jgi:hypothetical protein
VAPSAEAVRLWRFFYVKQGSTKMLAIYDRASMVQAMTLDLQPQLRSLLERRSAALKTAYGDLSDATEFFVIQCKDREDDIVEELGFSPLVEPIDGARYGTQGFRPYWDHLVRHDGYYEMAISYGSTFATIIFIEDDSSVLPALRALCLEFGA